MRSRRAVALSATGIAMALTLTGCGSVEPKAWAADVCSSVKSMDTKTRKQAKELTLDPTKPADTQKSIAALLGTLSAESKRVAGDVEEAGTPDVENGEKISTTYVERLQKASSAFGKAQKDVQAADSKDNAAVMKAIQDASADLQQHVQRVGDPSGVVDSPELRSALQSDAQCQKIGR